MSETDEFNQMVQGLDTRPRPTFYDLRLIGLDEFGVQNLASLFYQLTLQTKPDEFSGSFIKDSDAEAINNRLNVSFFTNTDTETGAELYLGNVALMLTQDEEGIQAYQKLLDANCDGDEILPPIEKPEIEEEGYATLQLSTSPTDVVQGFFESFAVLQINPDESAEFDNQPGLQLAIILSNPIIRYAHQQDCFEILDGYWAAVLNLEEEDRSTIQIITNYSA